MNEIKQRNKYLQLGEILLKEQFQKSTIEAKNKKAALFPSSMSFDRKFEIMEILKSYNLIFSKYLNKTLDIQKTDKFSKNFKF